MPGGVSSPFEVFASKFLFRAPISRAGFQTGA
jgi:hypothetical protein